jgi:predicted RNase H-like HicB family nuclease
MVYHFKTHKEADGYWAQCIELIGCNAQGDTMQDLRANMENSLNLFLSEPENSKFLFPMPSMNQKKMRNVEKIKVDPSVAFAMLIRQTRLRHHYTLKRMAEILEYKNINSYVKLEKPKTSNPELRTIANITNHFKDFPVGLIFE